MSQFNKEELKKRWVDLWLSNQNIETIILHNSGLTKEQLFMVDKVDSHVKTLNDYSKISSWQPIQYVLQCAEFYGRDFYVDSSVLIPRIDTELFIDVIKDNWYSKKTQIIDIWTGSGILAITLALELRWYRSIIAIDISPKALAVAKKNARTHSVDKQIQFVSGDLLKQCNLTSFSQKEKTVIVANLPYIKNADYVNMSESTVKYEPDLALYGWDTGFELYEKLIEQCLLLWEGWADIDLYIEIGFDQKELTTIFLEEKQLDFEFFKDSATIDRVVYIHGF